MTETAGSAWSYAVWLGELMKQMDSEMDQQLKLMTATDESA
jgi:hypothetical protein